MRTTELLREWQAERGDRGGDSESRSVGVIEPMGRGPAPGQLALVEAFVNTRMPGGRDLLTSPRRLQSWLEEQGLPAAGDPVGDEDLTRVREVRDALRRLLLGHSGGGFDRGAAAALNRASRGAGLALRLDEEAGAVLEPSATGVDAAIGRLLAAVFVAIVEGIWPRLKICRDPDCGQAFYDFSKNRSATWCSMRTCGNRAKARAYRQRHRNGVR